MTKEIETIDEVKFAFASENSNLEQLNLIRQALLNLQNSPQTEAEATAWLGYLDYESGNYKEAIENFKSAFQQGYHTSNSVELDVIELAYFHALLSTFDFESAEKIMLRLIPRLEKDDPD